MQIRVKKALNRLWRFFRPQRARNLLPSSSYRLGSSNYLIAREREYGGFHSNVPRRSVSPLDPRSPGQLAEGGMSGGDRMEHHSYARHYATHLSRFVGRRELTVVECGILTGSGLALWSDLFPTGLVVGLDIDLSHAEENLDRLKSLGAFPITDPALIHFDQFRPNVIELERTLAGRKINVFVDDGFHSDETILRTYFSVSHLMHRDFVYFIEDNWTVGQTFRGLISGAQVHMYGELTVLDSSSRE